MVISQNLGEMKGFAHIFRHINREMFCMFVRHGVRILVGMNLVLILNNWKQHIFYLNQEENRYLAELRDALLPELMSGKIEV